MDEASVQRGLQKALSESSKSTKAKPDAELAPTDSDASSRSGSPDQCCPICLGKFRDKSFSDGCFHRFCFQCIREWAKVKSTCPLCKTPFKSIIHNVVSSDVYDQYVLQPTENGSFDLDRAGARFRYHTTLTNNRRSAWETRMDQLFNRQARLAERIHRENEARQRRQLIYAAGLRVYHMGSNRFTRYRETSPQFFRENPAMTHRLIPWLRRDLSVLFNGNTDHVTFMTQYILSLLPNVDIQTEDFHNHLRPFLYGRTEHFIHEFTNFARSPYDMDTYDQMAQYDFRAENPQFTATLRPQLPLVTQENSSSEESENNHSNNNNEVIVISDDESDANPVAVALDSAQSHEAAHNIPGPSSARDIAVPSTSYDLSSTHNPEPPRVPTPLDHDQPGPSGVKISGVQIKQEVDSTLADKRSEQSEDSSGSVEIVGYQKPFHLRTPVAFITISDESSEEKGPEPESKSKLSRKKHRKTTSAGTGEEKAGGKRKQKTKHTRHSHSSRTGNWSTDSEDSYYKSRHDSYYRKNRDSDEKRDTSRYERDRSPYHRNASRSPLYRKFREENRNWSRYYETRHDFHSVSRNVSNSKSRTWRSRSRSRSPSRSKPSSSTKYDDFSRPQEHSRESSRHSRDDLYKRQDSRSRSRERSRDRTKSSRDERHRRRSRSRSRSRGHGFDFFSDESKNSSKYSYPCGSTSSLMSRFSHQDYNPQMKVPGSPDRAGTSKAPRSPEPKRKRESENEQLKEGGDALHSKKHKHKHTHHKRKHKHKSKEKDKDTKGKNEKQHRHKSRDKVGEDGNKRTYNTSSDSTSVFEVRTKKRKRSKLSKELKTYIDPTEPHVTLHDLLNMEDNLSTARIPPAAELRDGSSAPGIKQLAQAEKELEKALQEMYRSSYSE